MNGHKNKGETHKGVCPSHLKANAKICDRLEFPGEMDRKPNAALVNFWEALEPHRSSQDTRVTQPRREQFKPTLAVSSHTSQT